MIREMTRDACLLIFTKPARPGRVKTRLVGTLTPEQAAGLHQAFLTDVLSRLSALDVDVRLAWALEDGESPPVSAVPGMRQEGDDLGERLYRGLARAAEDHPLVGAVGSDHPELEAGTVEQAFGWLREGADVVLGPADDGGYFFVGARRERLHPRLFEEIPWSSADVLSRTRDRVAELGLEVRWLPLGHDVDTPRDLERLRSRLERGDLHRLPATAACLRSWGLLPAEVAP
jgi:hypothetical protein